MKPKYHKPIRRLIENVTEPLDIAKQLGSLNLKKLIGCMWLAYGDMIKENIVDSSFDEDMITEEWYFKILTRWENENSPVRVDIVKPINQYTDPTLAFPRGSKPKIDFCFRAWKRNDGYFGAECKILLKNDKGKLDRYISTGVENFTSGRYGAKSSQSAVIGYLLNTDVIDIIQELEKRISSLDPIMTLSRDLNWNEPHYKSEHERSLDSNKILLHHMFFEFELD